MKSFNETPGFWEGMGDTLFPPERVAAADAEVEAMLALLGVDRPLDVLDMPCGVGRHSIAMARRGHRVTGVDLTESYLARAAAYVKATTLGPGSVVWQRADMRTYDGAGRFDLVTNLWTSFGYGPGREDDEGCARGFLKALRPGGRLVMDLAGKEVIARRLQTHRWHPRQDGVIVLEGARAVDGFTCIEQRWIAITPPALLPGSPAGMARYSESVGRLRVYSACELVDVLERVGFEECRVFGSMQGTAYDHEAQRLVVTARRAE